MDYVDYIEREGAPERHADKPEREGSEQAVIERMQQEAQSRPSSAQQDFIERDPAAKRAGLVNLTDAELDMLGYSSFGTIGQTLEERRRFWQAVEEAETKPQGDTVLFKGGVNQRWWNEAYNTIETAPKSIQADLKRAYVAGKDAVKKLPTDIAFAVHQWAVAISPDAPIELKPGRGGRTQSRIIAELPHELDPQERVELVRNFADKLTEHSFPYWAVIHAPDANNDERNFHVHIIYYDRPTVRMEHPSTKEIVWDFEVVEEKIYRNYTRREIRPYERNKPRHTQGARWIKTLRKHWGEVSNAALEKAGVEKRYHLGTNASVGIHRDPLTHIHFKTFNKERKGELTKDGVRLACRQWDAMLERILMGHRKRLAKRLDKIDRMERKLTDQTRGTENVARVKNCAERARKSAQTLVISEICLDITKWSVDRIASRSKLMLNTDENTKRGQKPLANREELLTFLDLIFKQGLRLNRENEARVDFAGSRYRLNFDRLAVSGSPHKMHSRSALTDDAIVDQYAISKDERMQRVSERLGSMDQAMLSAIIPAIAKHEAQKVSATPEGPSAVPGAHQSAQQEGGAGSGSAAAGSLSFKLDDAELLKFGPMPTLGQAPNPPTGPRSGPQRTLYQSDQQIAARRAQRERVHPAAVGSTSVPTIKPTETVQDRTGPPGETNGTTVSEHSAPVQQLLTESVARQCANEPLTCEPPAEEETSALRNEYPRPQSVVTDRHRNELNAPLAGPSDRTNGTASQQFALAHQAVGATASAAQQTDDGGVRVPSTVHHIQTAQTSDPTDTSKPRVQPNTLTSAPPGPQRPRTAVEASYRAPDHATLQHNVSPMNPATPSMDPKPKAAPKTGIERVLGHKPGFRKQNEPADKHSTVTLLDRARTEPAPSIATKARRPRKKRRSAHAIE